MTAENEIDKPREHELPNEVEEPKERKIEATLDGVGEKKKKQPVERPDYRVLVVEDSKPLRRMLEKLLLNDGYIVDTAENGQKAVKKLESPDCPEFHLMVLDIMMPEMDGVQTMAYIRKNNIKIPPVVICSSRSDMKTVELVGKLGAAGYILKPFKTETVLAKVRKTIFGNAPAAPAAEEEEGEGGDAAEAEAAAEGAESSEADAGSEEPAAGDAQGEDPPSSEIREESL